MNPPTDSTTPSVLKRIGAAFAALACAFCLSIALAPAHAFADDGLQAATVDDQILEPQVSVIDYIHVFNLDKPSAGNFPDLSPSIYGRNDPLSCSYRIQWKEAWGDRNTIAERAYNGSTFTTSHFKAGKQYYVVINLMNLPATLLNGYTSGTQAKELNYCFVNGERAASANDYKDTVTIFSPTYTATQGTAMYRLYNKWTGEHFFTSDASEVAKNVKLGWKNEGIGWYAPSQGSDVYRLYNKWTGEHHFTTNLKEKNTCIKNGWKYEGVGWKSGGTVPVYRLYNRYTKAFYHHYTTDASEKAKCIKNGWKDEGTGWFGA